jgi:hypothetical protein
MFLQLPGKEPVPFPMTGKSMLMFEHMMAIARRTPGAKIIVFDFEMASYVR